MSLINSPILKTRWGVLSWIVTARALLTTDEQVPVRTKGNG